MPSSFDKRFEQFVSILTSTARADDTTVSGTRFIGRAPAVAPLAWAHILYKPLDRKEVQLVQDLARRPVPLAYQEFLARANGASIFVSGLVLFGLVGQLSRDPSVRQPISIAYGNSLERCPVDPNWLSIGGYDDEARSALFMDPDGSVYRYVQTTRTTANKWTDIMTMLITEVERMAALIGPDYRRLNPNAPLTPLPDKRRGRPH